MALNKEFFDSIDIEVVKKKYFNANKVRSLLAEIQLEVQAMSEENTKLKEEVSKLTCQKTEISETLISAQALASQLSENAKAKAEEIIAKAEANAAEITKRAEEKVSILNAEADSRRAVVENEAKQIAFNYNIRQQEHAVKCVESCFDALKKQQEAGIEKINEQWQSFLCSLSTDPQMESDTNCPPPVAEADDEASEGAEFETKAADSETDSSYEQAAIYENPPIAEQAMSDAPAEDIVEEEETAEEAKQESEEDPEDDREEIPEDAPEEIPEGEPLELADLVDRVNAIAQEMEQIGLADPGQSNND